MIKIETETDPKKVILRDKNIQFDIIRYGMKVSIKGTMGFKGWDYMRNERMDKDNIEKVFVDGLKVPLEFM